MLFKSLSLLFCVLSRSNVPVFLTTLRRSLRPTTWTMVRPTSEPFHTVGSGPALSSSSSKGEHRKGRVQIMWFAGRNSSHGNSSSQNLFPCHASQVTGVPPWLSAIRSVTESWLSCLVLSPAEVVKSIRWQLMFFLFCCLHTPLCPALSPVQGFSRMSATSCGIEGCGIHQAVMGSEALLRLDSDCMERHVPFSSCDL